MRLMRLGEQGFERPIVWMDPNHYVDVSGVIGDYDEAFFAGGVDGLRGVFTRRCAEGRIQLFAGERVAPPTARPHQILCIRLNYLAAGDVVTLGGNLLDRQRQLVVAPR